MENVLVGSRGLARPPLALVGYVVGSMLLESLVVLACVAQHEMSLEVALALMGWLAVVGVALLFGVGFFWYTSRLSMIAATLRGIALIPSWAGVVCFVYAAVSLYVLTRPTVKTFFQLRCPRCNDTSQTRVINFFGTRAGCRTCQTTWKR